jgi:hypothetical protein
MASITCAWEPIKRWFKGWGQGAKPWHSYKEVRSRNAFDDPYYLFTQLERHTFTGLLTYHAYEPTPVDPARPERDGLAGERKAAGA